MGWGDEVADVVVFCQRHARGLEDDVKAGEEAETHPEVRVEVHEFTIRRGFYDTFMKQMYLPVSAKDAKYHIIIDDSFALNSNTYL